jgi:hypothetical protein
MYLYVVHIHFFLRVASQQVLYHVLKQFNDTIVTPAQIMANGTVETCVFVTTSLCDDNEESYSNTNQSYKSAAFRCRICKMPNRDINYEPCTLCPKCKDTDRLHDLSIRYQPIWERWMNTPANKRVKLTDTETAISKNFKKTGLLPGVNVLHEIFAYLSHHGLGVLFCLSSVDMLHTFYKGDIEMIVR